MLFHPEQPWIKLSVVCYLYIYIYIYIHTFILQKKIGPGLIFSMFASEASILIGKEDEYEINEKTYNANLGLAVQGPGIL